MVWSENIKGIAIKKWTRFYDKSNARGCLKLALASHPVYHCRIEVFSAATYGLLPRGVRMGMQGTCLRTAKAVGTKRAHAALLSCSPMLLHASEACFDHPD